MDRRGTCVFLKSGGVGRVECLRCVECLRRVFSNQLIKFKGSGLKVQTMTLSHHNIINRFQNKSLSLEARLRFNVTTPISVCSCRHNDPQTLMHTY